MNLLERAIAAVDPIYAVQRAQARLRINVLNKAYEAATPGRLRKGVRDEGSGTQAAQQGHIPLRDLARHLDRNNDVVHHAFNIIEYNVVGTGIGVQPQPRMPNGEVILELAAQLEDLWLDFCERPDVTGLHDYSSAQRMQCRSLFRDGEVLTQHITGTVPGLDHGSVVPYSIELLESELLAFDVNDPAKRIINGVQFNAWNRPTAYHIYKEHPSETHRFTQNIKVVPAQFISHAKIVDRINQVRGVSVAASVLARLQDIKDYEESERIAAKIAAALTGVIKRGDTHDYMDNDPAKIEASKDRTMQFGPGMFIDDLLPGESIEILDSKRPNTGLDAFINGQLRRASGGLGVSYSSLSKNYDGTYSSQRQEMVEQHSSYSVKQRVMITQEVRPTYRKFVQASLLCGAVKLPKGMEPRHLAAAMFIPPQMPWIDPLKEALGYELLERRGWIAGDEVIRRRGGNPEEVLNQTRSWRERREAAGLPDPDAKPAAVTIKDKDED